MLQGEDIHSRQVRKRLPVFTDAQYGSSHASLDQKPSSLASIRESIQALDCLNQGHKAVDRLVCLGIRAIEPLRQYLLCGRPSKIFQPRLLAVTALSRLGAKRAILDYLQQGKHISDPEDRFGEEAVASAAVRALSAWPEEEVFQYLLELSNSRMLHGLIETLAVYKRAETIPFLKRALEDDFYRPAAEMAFQAIGEMALTPLIELALNPRPDLSTEAPSSLKCRRSATRLLTQIKIDSEHWSMLKRLILQSDEEIVVNVSLIGIETSPQDRISILNRLNEIELSAPWHLRDDIEIIRQEVAAK